MLLLLQQSPEYTQKVPPGSDLSASTPGMYNSKGEYEAKVC